MRKSLMAEGEAQREPEPESIDDDGSVATAVQPESDAQAKPSKPGDGDGPPRWAVMLHNDPVNSYEFVVVTLMKVLRIDTAAAMRLTETAHTRGKCAVWTGMKEPAEFKAHQITAMGPDPVAVMAVGDAARPLKTTLEKVPGGPGDRDSDGSDDDAGV